ncbi:uncharacterized protein BJX67DRAFT_352120 [Aspergillus lucknowensis]|uniref:t-SNARE coiled-coil homology domain-containing protein n=1 Tax=Aspergillus lucknowensis TaxID=176173 RepID=A0ABR4LUA0_9EURO
MQDMHKDEERAWKAKIDELDRQFRKQIAEKEEELEELEDSIREIRGDASHSRVSMKADKEVSEHEAIVRNARREVVEARDAHANLRDHIANGLANGVAASVTTGVMTAGRTLWNNRSIVLQPYRWTANTGCCVAMSGAFVCVVM